jgi:hypothetical protein
VYECPDEVSSNQGKFEDLVEVPEGLGWKYLRPVEKSEWLGEVVII